MDYHMGPEVGSHQMGCTPVLKSRMRAFVRWKDAPAHALFACGRNAPTSFCSLYYMTSLGASVRSSSASPRFSFFSSTSTRSPHTPPFWSPLTSDYRTVFCSGDFLVSNCLGVPDLKKFCKNFKPDGVVFPSTLRSCGVRGQN